MSRLLILPLFLICSTADAQSLSDAEFAAMIAKQRRTVSIDADGCLKNPNDNDDVIVVCGEPEENRRQKLPQRSADNDRIRRGEALSSTKAAAKGNRNCGVIGSGLGCIILPKNSKRFGSVPPPAIPLEEVYRGLPEPDMVVTVGREAVTYAPPEL
jgi:hypothetical protein